MPDLRTLLYLVVALRVTLLIAHPPQFVQTPRGVLERGITVNGDFAYHFGIAENTQQGLLPYHDYWYEYPPLIPLISGGIYALSDRRFSSYANLLALVLIAFDVGNILLVRGIGKALYGIPVGDTLAWTYALMPAPLILGFWNFEGVVTFFLLGSLRLLIAKRDAPAGILIALGALTKLVPLAALVAVWRVCPPRLALRTTGIALSLTGFGLGAILVFAPIYGVPSLTAQFVKPSFQTVWALIDGNFMSGTFNGDRRDPAAIQDGRGSPPRIPPLFRLVFFGGIGAAVYAFSQRRNERGLVAFVAITVTLLYLWSAGWSTQWQALVIPLILLTIPTRSGVILALALTLFSFAEYPLIFIIGADAEGMISAAYRPLFGMAILARTGVLIAFAVVLFGILRQESP